MSTTLARWDPIRELDSLFDGFFGVGREAAGRGRRWVPAIDVLETDEHLVLRADLPGLGREDVSIEIKDDVLTLSGERKDEQSQEAKGYYRFERSFGQFSRSLRLPAGIDAGAVTADFTDGVLTIRVPKPEAPKPHRVEIGGGAAKQDVIEEKSA